MSYEENKETVSAYVSTELRDKQRIETIRDNMMWNIDAETFYKRVTPHITIVPPFTIPKDKLEQFENIVKSVRLTDTYVTVNGAAVWRNIRNPYVVMLDVDVDIHDATSYLMDEAGKLEGTNFKEPVSPHITLFKSKGWWEEVPDTVAWKLQTEIKRNRTVQNTKIESLKLMVS